MRAIRGMGEAVLRPLRNPFSATSAEVFEADQLVLLTEYPAEKSEQTIEQLGEVFNLYDQLANPNHTGDSISGPEDTKIVVANSDRADEEEPLNKYTIARQISHDFESFDIGISLDIDRDRDDDTVITINSDDFFPVTGQGNDRDARGFNELLRQL